MESLQKRILNQLNRFPHWFINKVLRIKVNMGFGNLIVRSVISSKITENPPQGDREPLVDISKIWNHGNGPSQ